MEMNIDRTTKRCIAGIYKFMLLHFSGLSSNSQVMASLGKKSNGSPQSMEANGAPKGFLIDKSIKQKLPSEYEAMIE